MQRLLKSANCETKKPLISVQDVENKTSLQAQMLANRLQKRFNHLRKWAQRTGVGVFRLYDRDIPEIPLVLDFYGDCALPQEAAVSGALYKRPYEKESADEEKWLSSMKDSAAAALGILPERVFLKQRQRQKGALQYEKISEACYTKIVSEGGLAFKVNLSDYLDTGLFPDRRLLRTIVRSEASGKKILNLFSYTGSFSVYAAAGGAVSTDSVDISNTYLSWARENFSLNGFSASVLQQRDFFHGMGRAQENEKSRRYGANKLIRADVLDFLEKAADEKMIWDIIILDPPVFSNSKKMTGSFDLNRDITDLLAQCIKLLIPSGKLFFSANMRRIKIKDDIMETKRGLHVTDLSDKVKDEDFRGKKTPQSLLIYF
jgi:23S rRNA G2069 N7-methylase RlmK/C1962 C5-methylase RlmI